MGKSDILKVSNSSELQVKNGSGFSRGDFNIITTWYNMSVPSNSVAALRQKTNLCFAVAGLRLAKAACKAAQYALWDSTENLG